MASIFCLSGAFYKLEPTKITFDDIGDKENVIIIKIKDFKTATF